jgi:heme A synthase
MPNCTYPDSPVVAHKGWNEMIHRYFAGTLGMLISPCWPDVRGSIVSEPGQPWKLPLFLLAVVIAQAAFGMWTVTLKLWPQVVTGHLLGGFATLESVVFADAELVRRTAGADCAANVCNIGQPPACCW